MSVRQAIAAFIITASLIVSARLFDDQATRQALAFVFAGAE